jgi:septation ring formation regulator EzrA
LDAAEVRALRDALERAQARVTELEYALEEAWAGEDGRRAQVDEYLAQLHEALAREIAARDEAAEVVERLHQALDEAENPEPPLLSPGEHRQVVKLRAEVVALKHTRDRAKRDHERALDTIESLKAQLERAKKR